MKHVRMVTMLMILGLLLAAVPGAFAQDPTFGLSAADQSALDNAIAATAEARSGQFDFTLSLAFSGEGESGSVDLSGSGTWDSDAAGNPLFQLSIDGSANMGPDGMFPINAEIRLVSSGLYANIPMIMPQWVSLTGEEIEMFTEGMDLDPAAIAGGDLSALGDVGGMTGVEGMDQMMAALENLDAEAFVRMTRDGDRFTTTIDIVGLLASPDFQSVIVEAARQDDPDLSEAEIRQMMAGLPNAMQGTTLTLDQHVSDGRISRITLAAAFNIDPSAMQQPGSPGSFAMTFDMNLRGYNQSYPVTAPADSMPLMELFGSMMGG
jgi:hypothetical protein